MPSEPTPVAPITRQSLKALARRDKPAAERAMADLSPSEQLALVCETPPAERARLLALAPKPEALIAALPPAELCFTLKAIGLADSAWMLEHATTEQIVAAIDLDVWSGTQLELAAASEWLTALSRVSDAAQVRALDNLDAEWLTLALRARIGVEQMPDEKEDWSPPNSSQTVEGKFHYWAHDPGDDIADITTLLRSLFTGAYWTYFRLMLAIAWELDAETEEWALRWRTGRLEDLGFPPWDEAMGIYRYLEPERRDELPEEVRSVDVEPWLLPVWMPQLPEVRGEGERIFSAMGALPDESRRAYFYAFIALANRVAVADRMPLGEVTSTPTAIGKAARFASAGLAHLAERHGLDDVSVLERTDLQHLFRLGANLDPDSARPPRSAPTEEPE